MRAGYSMDTISVAFRCHAPGTSHGLSLLGFHTQMLRSLISPQPAAFRHVGRIQAGTAVVTALDAVGWQSRQRRRPANRLELMRQK